jgi:molybdenum cofactor synthesis domain-containing protein
MKDKKIKVAVLTMSTRASRGEYKDTSGEVIMEMIKQINAEVVEYKIIPDDFDRIASELERFADDLNADLVLTTGGTGFSPTDVTPEATMSIIERNAPGFVEAIRQASIKITPLGMLSRAVSGIRGETLIINLPGSPKAVRESLEVILQAIPHSVEVIKGGKVH